MWSSYNPTYELRQIGSVEQVFDFDYKFYCNDKAIQKEFEQMFYDMYMFNHLCTTPVARWKQMLKAYMNKRQCVWEQYYLAELRCKELDFMINKDYTETYENFVKELNNKDNTELTTKDSDRKNDTTSLNDVTSSNTSEDIDTSTSENISRYSDTPQNRVDDIDNYLTNVTKDNGQDSSTQNSTSSGQNSEEGSVNFTENTKENENKTEKEKQDNTRDENYKLIGKGNIGVTSSADLLKGWREVMIGVNEMIVDDLGQFFCYVM